MKLLSIDTTTPQMIICIIDTLAKNNLTDSKIVCGIKGHAKVLLCEIDALLKKNSLTIADMDAFAVVAGVGSFTGIRLGVSTMRAFCQVTGKKLLAVDSLKYRAYNVACKKSAAVCLDAASNSLYYAKFDGSGKQLCETKFCSICEAKETFADCDKIYCDIEIEGVAVQNYQNLDVSLSQYVCDNLDKLQEYQNIAPFYLKQSQAEENLLKKELAQRIIRNWTKSDIPALAKIEREYFTDYWTEIFFLDSFANPDFNVLICEYSGKIVSYVAYQKNNFEIDVTNVATLESERKKGNAKILINKLIEIAKENKSEKINLEVRVSNKAAQELYKSCGFEIVGIRKGFYTDEDGYTMSLFLNDE